MTGFYGEDLAAVHAEAFEALAEAAAATLLRRLPPSDGLILDLGCGAGPLSRRLLAEGRRVWGLDVSPALIRLARERLPQGEFVVGSVLEAELPAAASAAAIGEVLNYATAEEAGALSAIFQRVFDSVEPGGVFLFDLAGPGRAGAGRGFSEGARWAVGLIATEDAGQLLRRISTFRETQPGVWSRAYEEHRLRLWPEAEVREALVTCGFEVERLDGYDGFSMPPALHVYLARRPG